MVAIAGLTMAGYDIKRIAMPHQVYAKLVSELKLRVLLTLFPLWVWDQDARKKISKAENIF